MGGGTAVGLALWRDFTLYKNITLARAGGSVSHAREVLYKYESSTIPGQDNQNEETLQRGVAKDTDQQRVNDQKDGGIGATYYRSILWGFINISSSNILSRSR